VVNPLSLRGDTMEFLSAATLIQKAVRPLAWRWQHIGRASVSALWLYLFPAYCMRWTWQAVMLLILVIIGYGNIKYLLLILPFILPIHHE
jgi:hypothetical protein